MSKLYDTYIKELAALPDKRKKLDNLKNNYNTAPKVIKLLSSVGDSSSLYDTYNTVSINCNNRIKEIEKDLIEIPKYAFDLACKLEKKGQHEKALALINEMGNYGSNLGDFDEIKTRLIKTVSLHTIRRKRTLAVSAFSAIAFFFVVLFVCIIPQYKYNKALDLIKNKQYEQAYELLNEISNFKDSNERLLNGKYIQAVELKNSGSYYEAITIFKEIKDYKDSNALINNSNYLLAKEKLNNKDYGEAITLFEKFPNYKDSAELIKESKYCKATYEFDNLLFGNETVDADVSDVIEMFESISNYKDVNIYLTYYDTIYLEDIDTSISRLKSLPQNFYDVEKRLEFLIKCKSLSGKYRDAHSYGKWSGSYENYSLWYKNDFSFTDITVSASLKERGDVWLAISVNYTENEYRKRWFAYHYNSQTGGYGGFDDYGDDNVYKTDEGTFKEYIGINYSDFDLGDTISFCDDNISYNSGVLNYKGSNFEFSTTKK